MKTLLKNLVPIVAGATLLACLLGIALDLVTANVAVEYFTVHHVQIIDTDNPWLLALVWGIAASWWFGAAAGLIIGLINHGRTHPLPVWQILKWGAIACVILWVLMISVVVAVYLFAGTIPDDQRQPTFDEDRRLIAVAMAHQAEYVLGGIAVFILGLMTWRKAAAADENSSGPADVKTDQTRIRER